MHLISRPVKMLISDHISFTALDKFVLADRQTDGQTDKL